MDLFDLTSPAISAINDQTSAQLYKSTGYVTGANGKQVPSYADAISGDIQVQALSGKELQHLNNLNIGGVTHKIYLAGDWESVVRSAIRGGDKFVFSYGDIVSGTWLVATVLETWPGWCCVAVQLQVTP
jgi:hypothetical protein